MCCVLATISSPLRRAPLNDITVTFDDIIAAHARIAGHVEITPCLHSQTLSQITGAEVYLKFENLQFTSSFKERGALNKLSLLSPQQRAKGVIAVSAGNHAQGVAYHAQRLGVPAVIVMPRFSPMVKIERTKGFGAEVVLFGDTFDDAKAEAASLARSRALTMVHPYDDVDVIAGQGTIALEMFAQQPEIDCLCVAIGGGGLISGIAIAAHRLKPSIDIVGVQTDQFPSMYAAFKGVEMPSANATLAEGIAVKQPGDLTRADRQRAGRRRRAGVRRRYRAGDRDAARNREDRRRRRRSDRTGGDDAASRALRRPQGRPDPVRRQHRPDGAGRHYRARHGSCWSIWLVSGFTRVTCRVSWHGRQH